jgi:hypothetical protein
MNNKSWCNPVDREHGGRQNAGAAGILAVLVCLWGMLAPPSAYGGEAPMWMKVLVSAPVPDHDPKSEAVLLYAEDALSVQGAGKLRRTTRRVYKILRVSGKEYGMAVAFFDAESKVHDMHGWCIPADGKSYEVKKGDAIETSLPGVSNGELASDLRALVLRIPAADPGNIVGYEIEQEEHPYILQDHWAFQQEVPVREARYTLQLPSGWEYKATWLNHSELTPKSTGSNQWQWVVSNLAAIRKEDDMPPRRALEGQMLVTLLPPGSSEKKGFESWDEMGKWEANLAQGRRDSSPQIKDKVAELTANSSLQLAKMRTLAQFVQHDVRYVAIELGIGGWQPHPASEVFSHRYGDCKDKATLLSAMLKEIGIESYYLSINVTRGAVNDQTPPQMYLFNHEILGVRIPKDLDDPSVVAIYSHPSLGRILIFDPTDDMTPFGRLRGELQANYGLLVTPEGGDLVRTPQLSPSSNGVSLTGKLTLSSSGTLSGDVVKSYVGDYAARERSFLESTATQAKRVERLETSLSHSLSAFQITKASVANQKAPDRPFQYIFSFDAEKYARPAGTLLLVRPRVLGNWSSDILEKKEPRKYPVEFDGPEKDLDSSEIMFPNGYEVDELPPPVEADYSFASYHSKTEAKGNVLTYTRTMEIKELSVPVDKLEQLKTFYRTIAGDERNTVVLKPSGK